MLPRGMDKPRNHARNYLTFDPGRGFSVVGMDDYRIADAARANGFTVSALRFFEQEGVVVPGRTATGFGGVSARGPGQTGRVSLDEITELLVLLDQEECGPVHTRIRQLVTERIAQAQEQIA